jgi:hypothetical protein
MNANWSPPRCLHGFIILGCPHDDCEEQNAHLAETQAAIDAHHERQHQAARDIVRQLINGASGDDPTYREWRPA